MQNFTFHHTLMPKYIAHTHLATTHSTNTQLIEWVCQSFAGQNTNANVDYQKPFLLTADTQTGGRGQHGRTWQSPIGNVYFSMYMPVEKICHGRYFVKPPIDGRLSLCVGLSLVKMPIISQINLNHNPKIGVKWVNDIGFYQGDVFQKLAGILIEPVNYQGKQLGVVIGIGVNVKQAPILTKITQENLNYQAISLEQLTRQDFDLADIYQMMTVACYDAIATFNDLTNNDLTNSYHAFFDAFCQFDVLNGKKMMITQNNQHIVGIAVGIDNNGCLLLQTDSGVMPIWTGTIALIGDTSTE